MESVLIVFTHFNSNLSRSVIAPSLSLALDLVPFILSPLSFILSPIWGSLRRAPRPELGTKAQSSEGRMRGPLPTGKREDRVVLS
jgi:hypothetical protein